MVFKNICILVSTFEESSLSIGRVKGMISGKGYAPCPKHNDVKIFENHLNHIMLVHVGIHIKIALAEYSQMSTHLPGFQ